MFRGEFEEKALLCGVCEKYLSPPINLTEENGNVCSDCVPNGITSIRNYPLEKVFSTIGISCKYSNYGCKKVLEFVTKSHHEMFCEYEALRCPFCYYDDIFLTKMNFINHVALQHSDNLTITKRNEFFFELKIARTDGRVIVQERNVEILCMDGNVFHFEITEAHSDSSDLTINFIEINLTDEDYSKSDYSMVLSNGDKKLMEMDYKTVPFHLRNVTNNKIFVRNLMKEMNLNEITVTIEIKLKENSLENPDLFDCPICDDLMETPIYFCEKGHSLCINCREQLQNCPTCRSPFTNTRNYMLENVVDTIELQCKYKPCQYTGTFFDLQEHRDKCYYKQFLCSICSENTFSKGNVSMDMESHYENAGHFVKKSNPTKRRLSTKN